MTKMRPFRKIIDLKEHAQTYVESKGANSTLLYYISQSFGYRNIDDQHPDINIREIIWLGNQLRAEHSRAEVGCHA